ncbi:MAG TPA: sugar ABC transporter substrate-binding protein [bacterium]|nr:sugar ABC transporter substrate-binding protein [bacterium]
MRLKRTAARLVMAWLIVSCLLACKPRGENAPAAPVRFRPAPPALVEDRVGSEADLAVTEEEIAAARKRLDGGLVGIISCTMANEYHYQAADSAQKALAGFGLRAQIIDPEARSDKQIAAIENLTAAGARAIVICVLDPRVVGAALKEAANKGVYIVQYAGVESAVNGIGVSIDDGDLGRAAGEYAAKLINDELGGKAVAAILDYPDLPNTVFRANMIEAALIQSAPGAEIAGRYLGGTQQNALTSVENALQARPDINVVVSINDAGAYGAYQALAAAGKDPKKTIIVAIDGEKKARELIREGGMYRGTVDTGPARTGQLAAQGVVKILAGSAVPKQIKVPVRVITKADLTEK